MLQNVMSKKIRAAEVRTGQYIYVTKVPYARPTHVTVGWHEVLKIEPRGRGTKDVVGLRIKSFDMTERNDVLFFNAAEHVLVRDRLSSHGG